MIRVLAVLPLILPAAAAAQTFANPPAVAPPVATYSHIAKVPADSDLLVLAGQVGNAPSGKLAATPEAQYEQALRNVVAILASEGAGPANLVKLTTYLVAPLDPARAQAIRSAVLGDAKPPATLVYVSRLAQPAILVEIDAMAVRPKSR